jgi:hypothetical protein
VADAQDSSSPVISTERPSYGPSPDLIPKGSLQMESGAGITWQSGTRVIDLPENMMRLGLTDKAEFRFQTSNVGYQTTVPDGTKSMQSFDTAASVKLLVGGANRLGPKSVILAYSFPTGGSSFTSASYDPSLTAIWTQNLLHGYSLIEVAAGTWTTENGARRAMWSPGISAARALTAKFGVFGEYAPNRMTDGSWTHGVDGGFLLLWKNLRQFDVRGGFMSDAQGLHPSVLIGYSVRRDGYFR